MKYLFLMFVLISVQVFAEGSTSIQPINAVPTNKVTVNVLHMTTKAKDTWLKDASHNLCPAGSSELWYKFFPIDAYTNKGVNLSYTAGKSVNGIFAYVCEETFWDSDVYYKSLKAGTASNPWVTCQDSTNDKCSIILQRPPLILFIFKTPAPAGVVGKQKFVTFHDATIYINGINVGQAVNNINNPQEGALYYTYQWTTPNIPPNIAWYMQGENFNGLNYSSARTDHGPQKGSDSGANYGYFRCGSGTPPTLYAFTLQLAPIMAGQTCTITCKGDWQYNPQWRGEDTWWSGYEWVSCAN